MTSAWYLLYVRPPADKNGEPRVIPFPLVGSSVVHHLVYGRDSEIAEKDKKNPLWPKIQDGARPAWAPDFFRQGYAYVYKREGLPKLAVKMGIKNPEKQAENGLQGKGRKRVLTFDDVWVVNADPPMSPLHAGPMDLSVEDWWAEAMQPGAVTDPYIAPGGVKVMSGVQRLADVVSSMLATPDGYPRPLPDGADGPTYSEFSNPLVPIQPKLVPYDRAAKHAGAGGAGMGYASTPTFRW